MSVSTVGNFMLFKNLFCDVEKGSWKVKSRKEKGTRPIIHSDG